MAVPVKYREIGDFHEYYSGVRTAKYLTIFVGGNHEASNHLWELHYGGWVAPNIYYLGAANVVRLGPVRIAGLSGIWKGYNYKKPHYERLPYSQDDVRSIYHVRELDTRKLLQIRTQVDIGMSHDWPRGVEWQGDFKTLFKKKDLFEADARAGNLGSVAAQLVMERLRPPHWFSAHLHIKYAAIVDHTAKTQNASIQEPNRLQSLPSHAPVPASVEVHNSDEIDLDVEDNNLNGETLQTRLVQNTDEINLDDDIEPFQSSKLEGNQVVSEKKAVGETIEDLRSQLPASFAMPSRPERLPDPPNQITNTVTQFLSLDKCLPRRDFLQLLEVRSCEAENVEHRTTEPLKFMYDPEWLAITRLFEKELKLGDETAQMPRDQGRAAYLPQIEQEERWVEEHVVKQGLLDIPNNFVITAPVQEPSAPTITHEMPSEYNNPQTQAYCSLLGMANPFFATEEEREARKRAGPKPSNSGGDGGRGRGGSNGRGGGRGRGNGRGRGRGGGGGRGNWSR